MTAAGVPSARAPDPGAAMKEAVAPDGRRWHVARRWTRRRIRWRGRRRRAAGEEPSRWWEAVDLPLDVAELAELHPVFAIVAAVLLAAVVVALAGFVVVPALLALVDAVVLLALLALGALARTLLGRPWEVEATTEGPRPRPARGGSGAGPSRTAPSDRSSAASRSAPPMRHRTWPSAEHRA